jgi:hypothetical protein
MVIFVPVLQAHTLAAVFAVIEVDGCQLLFTSRYRAAWFAVNLQAFHQVLA